jgi:hypothetical protein
MAILNFLNFADDAVRTIGRCPGPLRGPERTVGRAPNKKGGADRSEPPLHLPEPRIGVPKNYRE